MATFPALRLPKKIQQEHCPSIALDGSLSYVSRILGANLEIRDCNTESLDHYEKYIPLPEVHFHKLVVGL